MNRKEAMAILDDKTTQQLLSKQVLWQFQIAAIDEGNGKAVKKRRRELKKELVWIREVISKRPDVTDALAESFGSDQGDLNITEADLTAVSWDNKGYEAHQINLYDEDGAKHIDASKHPRVKVVHNKPGRPPKQIIGMDTLDMKAKHGFEP